MKVLSFGSLNIDYTYQVEHFVQKGETLSANKLNIYSGGKGLNQAIALARAGAEVYHAGAVGDDGAFLIAQLKDAGVDTRHIKVCRDVRTGHAIIQNSSDGDNCILLFGGANQTITKEQADQVYEGFHRGDWLLLQNEINQVPYLMQKAHEKGMQIVLNPSPMNEKIFKLPLEKVDYFILNEIEAGLMLDIEKKESIDGEMMIRKLHDKYPNACIVLTMGERGALCMKEQEIIFQKTYCVKAKDTTAAGDTFTGYFLKGMVQGDSVRNSLDMAAKAAAIAVTRQGAAPSIPKWEEVLEFKGGDQDVYTT
ncbi:MAG: ribokinase [Bariatricus sp.]